MSIESIPKTANKTEQLQKNTDVKSNHISVEHSAGSSIFSPPTASALSSLNGKPSQSESTQPTVAAAVVKMLEDLGVRRAFGVSGGAIASLWASLENSAIEVLHFRHEAGAVFAAVESYFVDERPVVVFTTTGPGITNALTGLMAARWEGAKVIFLSAATSAPQRGRWAFQETSTYTMPSDIFCTSGSLFHYATSIEFGDELSEIARRLAVGMAKPDGFVAHLSVPTTTQSSLLKASLPSVTFSQTLATAGEDAIAKSVQLLSEEPFAIWVGFGARGAAEEIRQLAERTGAAVMSSPRGKGIFPENHPQYIGVTGFGGHTSVLKYMQEQRPGRVLVLGTRLGEFTSFWSPALVPSRGFVHVDIDPQVPGTAYPSVETFSIQSDVQVFVKALLKYFPERPGQCPVLPHPHRAITNPCAEGLVRPDVLMDTIQRVFVEGSDAFVMTEAGNSFAWGTHTLRFTKPGRYRVSTGFGSMGHAGTGVLGAAIARNGKAIAILGDGAMLMNSEINTAVKYQIPAVWIVLNDARYNMCAQGMALLGFKGVDTQMSPADFVVIARGMGADGIRVESESNLLAALEKALTSNMPFVVDVIIDPTQIAPFGNRIQSLIEQGATETKGDLS
ncbi:ScyA-related TPP-binding enzyme [Funiculus sociatus GB2-A5]|uniref:ScyA-related TPP-binding enzyme n=1 Tax=Funiculus sociatus GB2-A5 TaxID=2933946 RepID=A0ABV0JT32_9CYAN|nr:MULTISPECIES: ScyA-related TPP-binding enzyme [unclassified Trichocoleus]MBD1903923.1 thiamine pyrophosphate-binding protein [Trichocoleus sp. FACHB-832]MBD2060792.1 thiamine pyrophosphate-binding protein [Trichocoleus sp. FACHB-6]